MQSDYRVKKLVTEEGGDVVAICYDVLYGETFEKYIGVPEDFDARENASNLLQDSNYEISDEIRAEIEETFGVAEFDDDQDYDGYQFYDFGDDDFEDEEDEFEDEEEFAVPTRLLKKESFNLREALNTIDLNTNNKYDLLNLYEACNLSENEKRALANIIYDQNDPSVIYDTLNNKFLGKEIEMPERVKDGVIHEDTNESYESKSIKEDIGAKTFSQWFDETNKGKYDKEWEADYYPFTNYIKTFPNAEVLKDATAEDIKNNAHKFYDLWDVDSVDREKAFIFASEELGIDYDTFYYAWLKEQPIESVNESVDEFEFDDEFNAYYDGYTSELTPEEKKLIILADDMGHWGDDFTDEGNPESESNLDAYNKAMEKAKKIAKEKGMSLVDFTNSLEEDLENSTEWEHTDKDGRKGRIRQLDDKGNPKSLTRKEARKIADFRGHKNDDLNPVLSECKKKK